MTNLQRKIETVLSGVLYVAIGTVLAVQVNAQNSKATVHADATPSNCEENKSPDAICTITPAKPDFKVCFSSKHPRCFELQKTKLIQSLNGLPAHDDTLDAKQVEQITKAVKEYRSWLEQKKASAPSSVCRNIVTVDFGNDRKDLCVSALPKSELQSKNKSLIELLETPPGLKSPR